MAAELAPPWPLFAPFWLVPQSTYTQRSIINVADVANGFLANVFGSTSSPSLDGEHASSCEFLLVVLQTKTQPRELSG